MREHRGLLLACAALAAGEYAASAITGLCEGWPFFLILAALVALFGYGAAWRFWHLFAIFFAGAALFLFASIASERHFQAQPWMRGHHRVASTYEPSRWIWKIKKDLSRRVAIGIRHSPEAVTLNRAILLGERAKLPRATRQTFVESGTIHVFAISGLHVMAIAWLLVALVGAVGVSGRFAGLVAIVILWAYVRLIGCPPSAIRAATMASFYFLAPVFFRRSCGLRAWAQTFIVMHVLAPTKIVDVGCALSFTVMLAILLAGEIVRGAGGLRQTLFMTLASWAAGVPIAAHVFGRITPGGLLANLILIPTAAGTVFAGMVGLLASFVSETLAAHLNNVAALFTQGMVAIANCVSSLPFSNFEVAHWSIAKCAVWYAAMLGILFIVWRRRRDALF